MEDADVPNSVLGKAVDILHAFRTEDRSLRLADLVRRTGLHKATAHRLAGELVALGLLDRDEQEYRLGGRLFELGMRASVERSIVERAMPFLQDLYERTHETVHLGILDGVEVVYVAKIGGHRQVTAPSRTGGRLPAYCTAIGKALLAHGSTGAWSDVLDGPLPRRTPYTVVSPPALRRQLVEARARGVAFEREESALGVTCVAAPVLDDAGPVCAVSLTGPTTRFRPEQHASALSAAAHAIGSVHRRAETGRT